METENDVIEIKPRSMFATICITQAVCVAVILIAILIIKLFFEGSYIKLQNWCEHNILEMTKITAFLDEETSSEI